MIQRAEIPDDEAFGGFRKLDLENDEQARRFEDGVRDANDLGTLQAVLKYLQSLGEPSVMDSWAIASLQTAIQGLAEAGTAGAPQEVGIESGALLQHAGRAVDALQELIVKGRADARAPESFKDLPQHQKNRNPRQVREDLLGGIEPGWFSTLLARAVLDDRALPNYFSALRQLSLAAERSPIIARVLENAVDGLPDLDVRVFNDGKFKSAANDELEAAGEYHEQQSRKRTGTVYLASKTEALQATILHELTHRLMKILFKGEAPYDFSSAPNAFKAEDTKEDEVPKDSAVQQEWRKLTCLDVEFELFLNRSAHCTLLSKERADLFTSSRDILDEHRNEAQQVVSARIQETVGEAVATAALAVVPALQSIAQRLLSYAGFKFDSELYSHFMEIYLLLVGACQEADSDSSSGKLMRALLPITTAHFESQIASRLISHAK